jgi:hypothetical protein
VYAEAGQRWLLDDETQDHDAREELIHDRVPEETRERQQAEKFPNERIFCAKSNGFWHPYLSGAYQWGATSRHLSLSTIVIICEFWLAGNSTRG